MARDMDEQQRVIREDRMWRGKEAGTASARREKRVEDPYVPKIRRRRDPRMRGEGSQSQAHVDYSSQVVDPTPAHDYADEGFVGYDRMQEESMFFQPPQDEAEDEGVPQDVMEDYLEANNFVPEGEGEHEVATQPRRRRAQLIPPYPAGEPPFPGGSETTSLLSDYARHVANPLWVNHNNMWRDEVGYKSINAGKRLKELDKPEAGLRWFWEHVEVSGLHGLIHIGYSTVTHAMICALCERWYTETSSFHLPVGGDDDHSGRCA